MYNDTLFRENVPFLFHILVFRNSFFFLKTNTWHTWYYNFQHLCNIGLLCTIQFSTKELAVESEDYYYKQASYSKEVLISCLCMLKKATKGDLDHDRSYKKWNKYE